MEGWGKGRTAFRLSSPPIFHCSLQRERGVRAHPRHDRGCTAYYTTQEQKAGLLFAAMGRAQEQGLTTRALPAPPTVAYSRRRESDSHQPGAFALAGVPRPVQCTGEASRERPVKPDVRSSLGRTTVLHVRRPAMLFGGCHRPYNPHCPRQQTFPSACSGLYAGPPCGTLRQRERASEARSADERRVPGL